MEIGARMTETPSHKRIILWFAISRAKYRQKRSAGGYRRGRLRVAKTPGGRQVGGDGMLAATQSQEKREEERINGRES